MSASIRSANVLTQAMIVERRLKEKAGGLGYLSAKAWKEAQYPPVYDRTVGQKARDAMIASGQIKPVIDTTT